MSTVSTDNASTKVDGKEESAHLLEAAVNGERYGSNKADQENLLGSSMVHGTSESNSKTLPQYVAALSAAGGAFAAGTLLGWTSPAEVKINNGAYDFEVSKSEFSWVGSAMTLGAAFVCIPTGILINLVGRKLAMLLLVLPFTLGWGLLIWAQNVPMMFVARFLLGIAGGAFCVAAPMYTGEIGNKGPRNDAKQQWQQVSVVWINSLACSWQAIPKDEIRIMKFKFIVVKPIVPSSPVISATKE
ncbi:glucose transporter type 3-like [Rhagoletis pomonella]|uniref:glucose transporter type 3-like n=1 Tax=Rhagoletis pomonella TaxID=28610 RepID=UPI00178776C1|nr:glucose transporter type 3-like [Rhagoletis pomonella]